MEQTIIRKIKDEIWKRKMKVNAQFSGTPAPKSTPTQVSQP
jgi:hypothetical protein